MVPEWGAAPGPVVTGTDPIRVQGAAGVADGWYWKSKLVTFTGSVAAAVSWMVLAKCEPPAGIEVPFSWTSVTTGVDVSASGVPEASGLARCWAPRLSTGTTS